MDYYLLIGGLKKGPFGFEELLQNGLTADVLVWHVGMTDWRKASEMEELGELLAQLPPPPLTLLLRLLLYRLSLGWWNQF